MLGIGGMNDADVVAAVAAWLASRRAAVSESGMARAAQGGDTMTPFWTGLLVGGFLGLFFGACAGFIGCALCVMAQRSDRESGGEVIER